MPLEALYQNLILDHYRNPRNFGKLDGVAVRVRHENPACGDHIELYVELSPAGRIEEIKFESWGCALGRASASMMTVAVKDQTATRAQEIMAGFRALFETDPALSKDLGDLQALAGVREFPARIPCVLLPWNALAESLNRSE